MSACTTRRRWVADREDPASCIEIADPSLAPGHKSTSITTRIPKSRSCTSSRRCTEGWSDKKSGAIGQGGRYQGCPGQMSDNGGLVHKDGFGNVSDSLEFLKLHENSR